MAVLLEGADERTVDVVTKTMSFVKVNADHKVYAVGKRRDDA